MRSFPISNLARVSLAALSIVALSGCELGPTETQGDALETSDYALVLFGPAGVALETALGTQTALPYDGRTEGLTRLPEALRLTPAQRDEIQALRTAFRAQHQGSLEALRSALERARAAREAGLPRDEIRTLMNEARPIARSLQASVMALHVAIQAVLTPEQRAWLEANRTRRSPPPGRSA